MKTSDASDCPSRVDLTDALDDGSLDERFGAHLARCAACREHVDGLAELLPLADRLRDLAAQGRFDDVDVGLAVDGFTVVREIHRGGQGVVYEARQHAPARTVALKVPLHGGWTSPAERRRFEREIDVIAELRHPRIVTLYGQGVTPSGADFFAMEYVDGASLAQLLDARGGPMPFDRALEMFIAIAEAVEYAHQVGVIHRDIKPGNVLVDADGEPHLLDFGLAKRADDATGALTQSGHFVGSLAWAAPEQVSPSKGQAVSERTDVHALGLVLYRMVTGRHAYDVGDTPGAAVDAIVGAEAERPSRVVDVPRDVDAVLACALEKRPEDRYASVSAMLADCRALRDGDDVTVASYTGVQRLRRAIRRHPGPFVAAAVALIVGVVSSLAAAWWVAATEHRERLGTIDRARLLIRTGDVVSGVALLDGLRRDTRDRLFCPDADEAWERERLDWALREFLTLYPLEAANDLPPELGSARRLVVHPGGEELAVFAHDEGRVARFAADSLAWLGTAPVPLGATHAAASPSGAYVALGDREGRVRVVTWDGLSETEGHAGVAIRDEVAARAAWSPVDDVLYTLAVHGPAVLASHRAPDFTPTVTARFEGEGPAQRVATRTLAVTERFVFVSVTDGRERRAHRVERSTGEATAIGPIVVESASRDLLVHRLRPHYVVDKATNPAPFGPRSVDVRLPARDPRGAALAPSGRWLATDAFAGAVALYATTTGAAENTVAWHPRARHDAAFTADEEGLVTLDDRRVRRWRTRPLDALIPADAGDGLDAAHAVTFSADGRRALVGGVSADGRGSFLALVDAATHRSVASTTYGDAPRAVVAGCVFDPRDPGRVWAGNYVGQLVAWRVDDPAAPETLLEIGGAQITGLAASPDGTRLALGTSDGRVLVWSIDEGRVVEELRPDDPGWVSSVVWLGDGTIVAGNKGGRRAGGVDVSHGGETRSVVAAPSSIRKVAAAPGASWALLGNDAGQVLAFDPRGDAATLIGRHEAGVLAVAVSDDERLAASADARVVKVWHVERRVELAQVVGAPGDIFSLAFSPSGRELLVAGQRGLRLWDLDDVDRRVERFADELLDEARAANADLVGGR